MDLVAAFGYLRLFTFMINNLNTRDAGSMNRLFTLLPLCLALTACQAVTSTPQSEPSAQTAASTPSTAAPTTPASKSFSQDTLLSLLVAEIAGQREEFDYALQSYSAAAQATKDPAISRRAFFIAEYMNAPEYLLSTAETWSQAAPRVGG